MPPAEGGRSVSGAFQTALMYGEAPGPEGRFPGVLFQLGGQAECGQLPPACGRRVVHTERAGSSVVNPGTGEAGCPHPCGVGSWVVHTGVCCAAPAGFWLFAFPVFSSSPPQGPPEAPRLSHVLMVQPQCCVALLRCQRVGVPVLASVFRVALYRHSVSYRIDVEMYIC
jgi:hypothetical protein